MNTTSSPSEKPLEVSEQKYELFSLLLQQEGLNFSTPTIAPIARHQPLALSFAQARLWFLHQLEPDSPSYNIPAAYRLTGSLNLTALEQSFNAVLDRHEILRTCFDTVEGQPYQRIVPAIKLELPMTDLRSSAKAQREAIVQQIAITEAKQLFDLAKAPLFRINLLQLDDQEHILLFTTHHIIFDGWSYGIFFQDLAAFYQAFLNHQSLQLPRPSIQYADFAAWQRLQTELFSAQLAYWKEQLEGCTPILNLPTDYPRPAIPSDAGAFHRLEFSCSLTQALRAIAERENVTLFMLLLTAFYALLYRYSGQTDIIIGTPIAGRGHPIETEDLIGLFVNTLPLRVNPPSHPSFQQLLHHIQTTTLAAYDRQDLPFEQLIEELQIERDLSRSPLFQVMFAFTSQPNYDWELADVAVTALNIDHNIAKFDLILDLQENSDGIQGGIEYSTDLFEAATIERMAQHFQQLLEGANANLQKPVSQLPLLTASERQQLLIEWNRTQADYPQGQCIHHLFEAQVERTPDAVAVVFEAEHLTYRELNQRANCLAHYLQQLGIEPETLVGVCMERSLEMVVGLLAILKAGGAYVPLDPSYPTERLSFILKDTQVPVVLTQQALLPVLPTQSIQTLCLDSDWLSICQAVATQSNGNRSSGNRSSWENPRSAVTADHPAYVIYTSGSTGQPKGVVNLHKGLCNRLLWMQETYQITEADAVLQKTPFSFDVSVWEFFWALLAGSRLIMARPEGHKDRDYLVNLIIEHHITTLHFVPSMLQIFLEAAGVAACTSLKRVICSGEALSPELQERFFTRLDAALYNLYGPTEASIDVTAWTCQRDPNQRFVPLGYPIANTQIYILDAHLQPVPIGVPGELHIGGVGLARNYLNRPELTVAKFIPHPFATGDSPERLYKTGDLARYLPDGRIEFLGRIDHQVKIRGFRIELGEIEAILLQYPLVRTAIVTIQEEHPEDKRLVAYLVAPPSSIEIDSLRLFLQQKLPAYMIPAAFVILEALPLTPNGKIDRRALPSPQVATMPKSSGETFFHDPIEYQVMEIWKAVLEVSTVRLTDNFFELGGHSLLAVRLLTQIEKIFAQNLPLALIFQAQTVEQMVQVIREGRYAIAQSAVIEFQKGDEKPPLICLAGAFGSFFYCYGLARYMNANQPIYALREPCQYGKSVGFSTIEDLAAHYVKALQTIQPQGPYFLAGYCSGGIVLFEVAQQLQAQGQEVRLMALLEPAHPNTSAFLRWCFRHFEDLVDLETLWAYLDLQKLSLLEKLMITVKASMNRKFKLIRQLNLIEDRYISEENLSPEEQYISHYLKTLTRSMELYVARPYAGSINVFLSPPEYQNVKNKRIWERFAPGRVQTHSIAGDHRTFGDEPHVKVLAEQLQQQLDARSDPRVEL